MVVGVHVLFFFFKWNLKGEPLVGLWEHMKELKRKSWRRWSKVDVFPCMEPSHPSMQIHAELSCMYVRRWWLNLYYHVSLLLWQWQYSIGPLGCFMFHIILISFAWSRQMRNSACLNLICYVLVLLDHACMYECMAWIHD